MRQFIMIYRDDLRAEYLVWVLDIGNPTSKSLPYVESICTGATSPHNLRLCYPSEYLPFEDRSWSTKEKS